MAKKRVVPKQATGRPEVSIDWDQVDRYLAAGCSGMQIASYVGLHHDTFYNRCMKDKGETFTDYSLKKRQKGEAMLHAKQFQSAMEGNTTMLVWLGKQRLGQSEQPKEKEQFNGSLSNLLDVLHMINNANDFEALVDLAKKNKKGEE